jgi:hypothetical protein
MWCQNLGIGHHTRFAIETQRYRCVILGIGFVIHNFLAFLPDLRRARYLRGLMRIRTALAQYCF